jgi:hypothetical protein
MLSKIGQNWYFVYAIVPSGNPVILSSLHAQIRKAITDSDEKNRQ